MSLRWIHGLAGLRRGALLALLMAALLGGCASPVVMEVSRFNAWAPELAGASFAFARPVDPSRELEQASYEALVEAELARLGLRRAAPGQAARLLVDLAVGAQVEQRPHVQPVYQDQPVFRPPWRDAAGRLHPGYWGPDPFGPRLVGHQQVLVSVQTSSLRLRLLDAAAAPAQPRTVFESTARHEAWGSVPLPRVVPWLVRAVFEDFPGQNGQVRQVRLDPRTGQPLRP